MASISYIAVSLLVLCIFATALECRAVQEELTIHQPEDIGLNGEISFQESARKEVDEEALLSIKHGAPLRAVGAIQEGIKSAINLLESSSGAVGRSFLLAKNKSRNDPDGAIREIAYGLESAKQSLYFATLPMIYTFERTEYIPGVDSRTWKKQGLKLVEYGGKYVMQSLKLAQALTTNGLQLNSTTASKEIDEAQEITSNIFKATYVSLVLAGKSAFEGISNSSRNENLSCNLDTPSTTQSEKAKSAETAVVIGSEQAQGIFGERKNTTDKVKEGFICGIRAVASGETSCLRAISIATEIVSKEPDMAISIFKHGMKILKKAIITAGNKTCQGLDDASHILGNQTTNNSMDYGILKIQKGITSALEILDLLKKIPSTAIKISGGVAEEGLKTVSKSVLILLSQFYSLLSTIAVESF